METPGELIKTYLHVKSWNQSDLSSITGWSQTQVSLIISGKRRINAQTAVTLEACFGRPAMDWMKLQNALDLTRIELSSEEIANRLKKYS